VPVGLLLLGYTSSASVKKRFQIAAAVLDSAADPDVAKGVSLLAGPDRQRTRTQAKKIGSFAWCE